MMKINSVFTRLILRTSTIILFVVAMAAIINPAVLRAEDYASAMKRAKAEDKAIVLYFASRYCPYCVAMERDVLADKEIAKTLKESVVSVRIDVEIRSDLATKYGVRGYPTTCLLEPSGKPLIKIPGYVEKKEFKVILDYAKGKHYKKIGLRDYMKKAGIDLG
jgi:thioredoxin-related protein